MLVGLEVHAVHLGLDTECLSLSGCECAHSDLYKHRGAIPVNIVKFGDDLLPNFSINTVFDTLIHHHQVDAWPCILDGCRGDCVA
jgi:hypothetical protein